MAFKKYTGGRTSSPTVTIRMSGEIAFNKGAAEQYLDSQTHAVLYYDADEEKMGIELTTDETAEGARPIRQKDGLPGAVISAKVFFDAFKIPYQDEKRTYNSIDIQDEMLVLQL